MTRAPSSGSPSFRSSSNSETRGSAVTFFVCSARLDNRKRGEPSTEVATFTNEQYGSPEPGSNVASAPDRASRRSFLAARKGSKRSEERRVGKEETVTGAQDKHKKQT